MSYPSGIFGHGGGEPVERHEFRYSVATPPAEEPVTLDEAKTFARIDVDDDDALVTALITASRIAVERETGRALITQTIDAYMDCVPPLHVLNLSYRPIQSVTTIEGINDDDSTDAVDSGSIVLDGANGRIGVKSTASAITGTRSVDAFHVQYVAGYGLAVDAPEWAKTAIKQLVAHWYEHRESHQEEDIKEVPYAIKLILDQHKVAGL
jgi:uncharacterized phiE125 gp8 family phage protein